MVAMTINSPKEIRVFINKSGKHFRIFKLFRTTNDPESIYLHMERHSALEGSGTGKFVLMGNTESPFLGNIFYEQSNIDFHPIDHSSVHADGRRHIKLKNGEYENITYGIPLKGLETAKPLWTIVPGEFKPEKEVKTLPKNEFVINEPDEVRARCIIVFAAPTGNLNLTIPFPVEYFDMSNNRFPLNIFGFQMPNFSIFLLVFSSLTFLVPPPRSYAFSDIGGLTPFIKSMQADHMEVELRGMVYSRSDHST